MRVVQVSAHYPPNHVSGGTLVPQRIAHDLAARGHEVFVYAGFLDEERQPLEGWAEVDGHGVTIRWVVTTPWTAWADPRNSINPEVAADFAAWLAEVRPDIVHLHSLQTLGAGLVPAARAAGAVVVVTMHDFWWTCARQFLVGPDLRPCSIVVDCGSCPCADGHRRLERRNAAIGRMLADADVVLAPSASAARVLVANGVDGRRVRVDENGLPDPESGTPVPAHGVSPDVRPRDRAPGGPVRLMFAGGTDVMKGLQVLLDAAAQMPDDGTWSLDLYGVTDVKGGVPAAVRALPAYTRGEMAEVFASHDVLVLPSVMRESHSILTREALQAGLAVVCTDTLGPEEAVAEGVNGLVVPAGDAASLRTALLRLTSDPALVRRLRGGGVLRPLRSLREQVDGLEALYRELVAPVLPTANQPSEPAEVLEAEESLLRRVLVVAGIRGAPLRYRAHLPAEALRLHGVRVDVHHYRDPHLVGLADEADAVVLYRVPATRQIVDLLERVRRRERAVPVLFDIDDLIFDPTLRGQVHGLDVLSHDEQELWWRGVARYRTTMELCDAYVGSTAELCAHASRTTGLPVFRYANGVGRTLARISERELDEPRTPGRLRVGYFSGTNTHDADWATVEPAIVEVLRRRPDVELWLGGLLTTGAALEPYADRVVRLPMLPWTELPGRLRQLDVNLAPLVLGSPFNEAKSAIKWLEAALVETPTVASPTEPFREAVEHGRTGLLAATVDEWAQEIGRLLDDELLRRRMGALARREALLRWGPRTQGARYLEILREVGRIRRVLGPRVPGDWEPVLDDEPSGVSEAWLDPYPEFVVHGSPVPSRALDAIQREWRRVVSAWRVLLTAGPGAVARKTVTVLRRRRGAVRY